MKKIVIIGGGTFMHVRSHLALSAPAFGTTARRIYEILHSSYIEEEFPEILEMETQLFLTKMAGNEHYINGDLHEEVNDDEVELVRPNLETNYDVEKLVDFLLLDPEVRIIIFNVALCDYIGEVDGCSGKLGARLKTREQPEVNIECQPARKIIDKIRKERKDIFLVGFKTTFNEEEDQQYFEGLRLLKGSSCNLVLANDTLKRRNMIITPEEARYHVTTDREEILENLVEMTLLRANLTFTRTNLVDGELVEMTDPCVPESFRKVVEFCIENGAYKPFRGTTVGHYGVMLDDNKYLVSRRKNDHSSSSAMIIIETVDGMVNAAGITSEGTWKPSAGGHTQRELFQDHPGNDCVVHFHCPKKSNSDVPAVPQRAFECGSHECGVNTSKGMKQFGNVHAVYLDEHGPNVIFNRNVNPQEVIDFIEANFDLSDKTGGIINGN